jgi:DNA-binding response OmpR family regulator
VTRSGREVTLTAREFDVLRSFVRHRDTVDVHAAELRKKLEKRPSKPRHLLSVRSVGYRFEA